MIVNIWKYFPLYSHILRTIGKSFKEKARLIYLSTYHNRGVRGQTLFLEVRPRLNFKGLAKNKPWVGSTHYYSLFPEKPFDLITQAKAGTSDGQILSNLIGPLDSDHPSQNDAPTWL